MGDRYGVTHHQRLFLVYMGVEPKIGVGKPPKWKVYKRETLLKWMIWVVPLFLETPIWVIDIGYPLYGLQYMVYIDI